MPCNTHKLLLALSIGIVSLIFTLNPASSASANCTQRTEIVEKLKERFGESRQSIGLTPSGQAIELFAHPQKGTWTILLTLPNGTSCMMASGHAYQSIKDPAGQGV